MGSLSAAVWVWRSQLLMWCGVTLATFAATGSRPTFVPAAVLYPEHAGADSLEVRAWGEPCAVVAANEVESIGPRRSAVLVPGVAQQAAMAGWAAFVLTGGWSTGRRRGRWSWRRDTKPLSVERLVLVGARLALLPFVLGSVAGVALGDGKLAAYAWTLGVALWSAFLLAGAVVFHAASRWSFLRGGAAASGLLGAGCGAGLTGLAGLFLVGGAAFAPAIAGWCVAGAIAGGIFGAASGAGGGAG